MILEFRTIVLPKGFNRDIFLTLEEMSTDGWNMTGIVKSECGEENYYLFQREYKESGYDDFESWIRQKYFETKVENQLSKHKDRFYALSSGEDNDFIISRPELLLIYRKYLSDTQ